MMAKTKKCRKSRKSKKCRKSRKNFRYKHRGGTIVEQAADVLPQDNIQAEIIKDLEKICSIIDDYKRIRDNNKKLDIYQQKLKSSNNLDYFFPSFWKRYSVWKRYSCNDNKLCELLKVYIYFILIVISSSYDYERFKNNSLSNKYESHLLKADLSMPQKIISKQQFINNSPVTSTKQEKITVDDIRNQSETSPDMRIRTPIFQWFKIDVVDKIKSELTHSGRDNILTQFNNTQTKIDNFVIDKNGTTGKDMFNPEYNTRNIKTVQNVI